MTLAMKGLTNILPAMRYYKKQIIFVILAIAILVGMIVFCAPPPNYQTVTDMQPFTETMLNEVDKIINPTSVQEVKELTNVTFSNGTLTLGGRTISNTTLITSINEICQGVAVIFVCMTFFISLFISKDKELQEEILKRVVFFLAALALVWYAQDICYAIAGIGSAITEKVAAGINGNGDIIEETTKNNIKQIFFEAVYVEGNGTWDNLMENIRAIGIYFQLLIPAFAMWICKTIITVTCWSRAFEIVTLSTFAPLAFADASNTGHFGHGGGSRFIKNMCALSISGAIILFVMMFCSSITVEIISAGIGSGVTEIISNCGSILTICFAEVGLVLKAQAISKTLLGVG